VPAMADSGATDTVSGTVVSSMGVGVDGSGAVVTGGTEHVVVTRQEIPGGYEITIAPAT